MRVRGPERSSILLLGRSTVIIGAIVITVLSFGLGYFWGYKGSDVSQTEDEVKKDTEQKVIIPPEDKRVLETTSTTPKEAPIAPSIKPPEFPQETTPQKSAEPEKELPKEQKTAESKAGKSHGVEIAEGRGEQAEKAEKDSSEVKGPEVKAETKAKTKENTPAANKEKNTAKSAVKKNAFPKTSKSVKLYAIQFGAFPNKEGAEQLRQSLISKGIKAYIVSRTESDPYFRVRVGTYKTKREADLAAVSLQKRTGMQNFVTAK
ncbi:MAG: SPOR domain-containing protein [Nitrospirota bacterium]